MLVRALSCCCHRCRTHRSRYSRGSVGVFADTAIAVVAHWPGMSTSGSCMRRCPLPHSPAQALCPES